ncbi:uncharacterized protein LTR77_004653 [Saxophila tyrrhenica]|uniref:Core Histone H2A/H2B/H3 domain-containing protein n=1 Tax=Saxophila tyrrhenica TaxID=1690608 RepID=A0AAV9PHI6_9PEZI|nr:hypothetical protein LTR77_004653 [Saxophila tyrrhenica]
MDVAEDTKAKAPHSKAMELEEAMAKLSTSSSPRRRKVKSPRSRLMIPKMPFRLLVRDVALSIDPNMRFVETAVDALQDSAEAFMTYMFTQSQIAALKDGRTTVEKKDMDQVLQDLGGVEGARTGRTKPKEEGLENGSME